MQLQLDQLWTYSEWLVSHNAWLRGTLLAITLSLLGLIVSYAVALVQYGPGEGFYAVARVIRDLFRFDIPGTRLSRMIAIAKLAFMEAIRRKILVGFGIFIVLLMFAGWFLDRRAENPAQLYTSFVLAATNFLILLLGLFISTFSLPNDIKSKTIYTIATKPVRPTEMILGRILGFSLIGSLMLAVLGVIGYVFVVRGLQHEHEVATVAQDSSQGNTDEVAFHQHRFRLDAEGKGVTDEVKGHQHTVTAEEVDGRLVYRVSPPIGQLAARVPLYGTLSYYDRQGNIGPGLNVGYMSEYRKFIAGGTLSSANWQFEKVRAKDFPEGLILEMDIEAFRTVKADIVTPVRGSIILRSPDQSVESERIFFLVKESLDRKIIPLQVKGFRNNQPAMLELFQDLIVDGRLEVIIRCEDSQQYFGMSPADLTLRAGDRSFAWNFFKGFISIWLQMVIVIAFGVMFSTFLSGPVAMVATLSALGLGFFGSNVDYFFESEYSGGGPLESIVRIGTQKGVMIDLDLGNESLERVIKNIDYGIMFMIFNLKNALPDFGRLSTSEFVAYGVNIFDDLMWRHATITLGYCLMACFIGYFFLKTREMAA
jgi:ABC-type transport system involved in multi-copper enzyme maturation permease subunit